MIQTRTEDEHRHMVLAYLSTVRDGLCLVLQPPESVPSHTRFLLDEESMRRVHAGMDMIVDAVTQGRLEKPGIAKSRDDNQFQQWLGEVVPPRPQAGCRTKERAHRLRKDLK